MEESEHCSVCSRTPLVGEGVTVRQMGRREAFVCDLCLGKPRAATLGDTVRRDRVRSAEGAANVARVFPTPVVPATTVPALPAESAA